MSYVASGISIAVIAWSWHYFFRRENSWLPIIIDFTGSVLCLALFKNFEGTGFAVAALVFFVGGIAPLISTAIYASWGFLSEIFGKR